MKDNLNCVFVIKMIISALSCFGTTSKIILFYIIIYKIILFWCYKLNHIFLIKEVNITKSMMCGEKQAMEN